MVRVYQNVKDSVDSMASGFDVIANGCGCEFSRFEVRLDPRVILDMNARKLRAIACMIWMEEEVREMLLDAKEFGWDVEAALALFPEQTLPSQ